VIDSHSRVRLGIRSCPEQRQQAIPRPTSQPMTLGIGSSTTMKKQRMPPTPWPASDPTTSSPGAHRGPSYLAQCGLRLAQLITPQ
jgi:hypothetical protein